MSKMLKIERDVLEGKSIVVHRKIGDTSFEIHRHDYYEIIIYYNCNGICVLNGREYSIGDNAVFLLTPQDYHRIESHNTDEAGSIVLEFSENIIDPYLMKKIPFSARVLYHPEDFLVKSIERLRNIYIAKQEYSMLNVKYLLNEILIELLIKGEKIEVESSSVNPIIAKSMMYILTDVSAPIDLETISSKFGISTCYYSELFHSEVGITFKKWLNRVRIDRAKHLLKETDMTVIDIALDCGYNTFSHFVRTFSSINNMTPSEYRKNA